MYNKKNLLHINVCIAELNLYSPARFPIIFFTFSKVKLVKKFYTRRKVIEYPDDLLR